MYKLTQLFEGRAKVPTQICQNLKLSFTSKTRNICKTSKAEGLYVAYNKQYFDKNEMTC